MPSLNGTSKIAYPTDLAETKIINRRGGSLCPPEKVRQKLRTLRVMQQ